ncbi:hypothetical protein KEM54_000372 [Ascosphaera aggregata]|nr:hypothetical protein KEM54_000372 [Ascosphaera aggregata]
MDPKMDSGYLAPGETLEDDYDVLRELRPEEVVACLGPIQARRTGCQVVVVAILASSRLTADLRVLVIRQAAWHMGRSISQTLFTSIYIDRILWPVPRSLESARFDRSVEGRHTAYQNVSNPDTGNTTTPSIAPELVSLVLRAFCVALVKACDRVHNRITLEYFFEEEDFVSQLFNRRLLSDIHTAEVVALVDEALSWLERQVPTADISSESGELMQAQIDALTSRLLFRRNLLIALDEDLNVLRSEDTSCFEESREHLTEILSSLSDQEHRVSISKPVPESFNTKFQRGLASTVPPRPIVDTISVDTALPFLSQLCTDAIDLVDLVKNYDGPESLFAATNVFMSRKRPGHKHGIAQLGREPSIYIRCLAQGIIIHASTYCLGADQRHLSEHQSSQTGSYATSQPQEAGSADIQIGDGIPLKKFVYDSLAELVLPHSRNRSLGPTFLGLLDPENAKVEHPEDPRFAIATIMNNFVERLTPTLVDMYRSLCLNRCRVRRFMTHSAVDWDIIQSEAEEFDTQLQQLTREPALSLYSPSPSNSTNQLTYSFPLSSWIYHHKLRLMRQIIQMGFELEIYAVEEIAGIYYQLSQLCASHLTHIDRIRVCVMHQQRKWRTAFRAGTSSDCFSASRSSNEKAVEAKFESTLSGLQLLSVELIAVDAFAIAMHAMYVLLDRYELLEPLKSVPKARTGNETKRQYSNAALKYELRMKPFLPITIPEVMPFDAFSKASTMVADSDEAVLSRATQAISEAKRGIEQYINLGTSSSNSAKSSSPIFKDWVADTKDCLRACIGTSLAINQLNKAISRVNTSSETSPEGKSTTKKETKNLKQRLPLPVKVLIPTVDEKARWHPWWAVPQIVSAP